MRARDLYPSTTEDLHRIRYESTPDRARLDVIAVGEQTGADVRGGGLRARRHCAADPPSEAPRCCTRADNGTQPGRAPSARPSAARTHRTSPTQPGRTAGSRRPWSSWPCASPGPPGTWRRLPAVGGSDVRRPPTPSAGFHRTKPEPRPLTRPPAPRPWLLCRFHTCRPVYRGLSKIIATVRTIHRSPGRCPFRPGSALDGHGTTVI